MTKTPFLGFELPDFNSEGWHDPLNRNLQMLDNALYKMIGMSRLTGLYQPATSYNVGEVAWDEQERSFWLVDEAHVSGSANITFKAFRTANPQYWSETGVRVDLPEDFDVEAFILQMQALRNELQDLQAKLENQFITNPLVIGPFTVFNEAETAETKIRTRLADTIIETTSGEFQMRALDGNYASLKAATKALDEPIDAYLATLGFVRSLIAANGIKLHGIRMLTSSTDYTRSTGSIGPLSNIMGMVPKSKNSEFLIFAITRMVVYAESGGEDARANMKLSLYYDGIDHDVRESFIGGLNTTNSFTTGQGNYHYAMVPFVYKANQTQLDTDQAADRLRMRIRGNTQGQAETVIAYQTDFAIIEFED